MRTCMHSAAPIAAAIIVALSQGRPSFSQTSPASDQPSSTTTTPPDSTPITRDEFNRRMQEIQTKYQQDLAARDKAIEELRAELARRPPERSTQETDAERARLYQDDLHKMLADIDAGGASLTPRTAVSFNPDFAVVSDFLGTWSDDRSNDAYNRFDVREVELDLRAAVDPRADAVAILAFARDVENPVFPEGEPLEGPETSVEVEEAYLFLHDFGVPNLTAQLGRFHVRFGRQNLLHLHDLPTSDPSLVNQAFLAPEALVDSGLSLSYLIPNPWNQYFEAVFQVLAGEGGSNSESPTLSGDLTVDSPAFDAHLLWNTDIGGTWNMELGGSWLYGPRDNSNDLYANIFGLDATFIRTDPSGGFDNLLLQSEAMWALTDQAIGSTQHAFGAYLLAQQQLNKDWYIGVRGDYTQDPNDSSSDVWAVSPYVSWYWSEFLRFRVEYQHRGGNEAEEDVVMFQVTWIFGAHPPHPYWAMR